MELPDGRHFTADDPDGHQAVSEALDRTVTLVPEGDVPHHDEGPVSLITTAALRRLTELTGPEPNGLDVDPPAVPGQSPDRPSRPRLSRRGLAGA